jgi:hypothetical protein
MEENFNVDLSITLVLILMSEINCGDCGSTVVKVLRYKSEGHWFDPRWCHWNFFIDINPSDRTMALGSTQPLTEMSTGSITWGYIWPVRKADNLTTILCHCQEIWEP